jgi:signal recognition particle subunit SRP72
MSCYSAVLKLHPDDPALIAVTSNNVLVLNGDKDIFDSKKRVKVLASEGSSRKLTRLQKLRILFNRCMFSLQINQLDQCRELGAQLKAACPNSDLTVLAGISLMYRERKFGAAVEFLEGHLKSHSSAGVQLYTALAQLQLLQGNIVRACEALRSIPASVGYVGVASTLSSLYVGLGDVDVALNILKQTLDHWMSREVTTSDLVDLAKQVARFQLSHSHPEAASEILEKALKRGDNMELRALLISAYSQTDPRKAEEISRDLPAFQTPPNVDVDGMEKTPFFRHSRRPAAEVRGEGGWDGLTGNLTVP